MKRAFAGDKLLESIASDSEAQYLGKRHIREAGANLVVWRRSCLFILVFSSAVALVFSARDTAAAFDRGADITLKGEAATRRLVNGTDPREVSFEYARTDFLLQRPKILGGPGCNTTSQPGECSFADQAAARKFCSLWSQCGGFVCRADRVDCQARGRGTETDAALAAEGYLLPAPLRDPSLVECSCPADAGIPGPCPRRADDPSCGRQAVSHLKTPSYDVEPFADYTQRAFRVAVAKLATKPARAAAWLQAGLL